MKGNNFKDSQSCDIHKLRDLQIMLLLESLKHVKHQNWPILFFFFFSNFGLTTRNSNQCARRPS